MQDGRGAREGPRGSPDEPFGEPVENDPTQAVEEGEPYFPPTDPVTRQTETGETKIAGGFGRGEIRDGHIHAATEVAPSDEAIEDAVRAELALDASTAHLRIGVSVRDGVARLVGVVADATDAENAVAVAGRVPGVSDVLDELGGTA
jgi:BON domain-containing protein